MPTLAQVKAHVPNQADVAIVEAAFADTAETLDSIGARLKVMAESHPDYATVDAAFDAAFAAHELACDNLREVRDGYRYTYPIGPCGACGRWGRGCNH